MRPTNQRRKDLGRNLPPRNPATYFDCSLMPRGSIAPIRNHRNLRETSAFIPGTFGNLRNLQLRFNEPSRILETFETFEAFENLGGPVHLLCACGARRGPARPVAPPVLGRSWKLAEGLLLSRTARKVRKVLNLSYSLKAVKNQCLTF